MPVDTAYLDSLNREQRRAVEHGVSDPAAGPLLVIAGAGSGKTNTLAHRVAHLIVHGADPRRMLLLTFSRRAAADPYYGYGYRPDWPSILSVAHDTLAGENLYVIMDRPCTLLGIDLPLVVHGAGGEALAIVAAAMVLPNKFQVTLSDAVPAGATWAWSGGEEGGAQLVDAVASFKLG